MRPQQTRRVHENRLRGSGGENRRDRFPRGLCLRGYDAELFTDQRIEQCGFAHVRRSDERDVTGAGRFTSAGLRLVHHHANLDRPQETAQATTTS